MFKIESNKQGLGLCDPPESYRAVVTILSLLTLGDLAAVSRQHWFRPIISIEDLTDRLRDEVVVKRISSGKVMGILAGG